MPNTDEKLKQRNRELAILKAIVEELNRASDIKSVLENSLRLVAELLGLKAGWVWLVDQTNGEPYLAASQMLPPFLTAKPSRMQGDDCLCLSAFLDGDLKGAENINVLKCSRLLGAVNGTDGLRYHASIPIYAHDKPLGVMNVAGSDWRELEPDDLQLLYTIGYQIGIAIERARLFDQTVKLATVEERNRLAREIHDTIAQGLAATILNLESADILLDDPDPQRQAKGRQKLQKALTLSRANLEEARRSVLDLRASDLQDKPLGKALADLLTNFQTESGLQTEFSLENTDLTKHYPARIEAGIYRIVQEALTNVQKHANATHVKLKIALENNHHLKLYIEDNGIGFDAATLEQKAQSHFGLIGMNERAKLLGGELLVKSCPASGTDLELSIPLN